MEATDRQIQLIVYRSPLFPAHWSLFIPTESNPDFGKRIHAIGDPLHGFQLEFKRGYDLSATSSKKTVIDLCRVDGVHVVDGPAERGSDKIPIDDIEKKATEVPAPEGSMNPAGSTSNAKVEIKNCQTWLTELVQALVKDGIFPPEALATLAAAPKN